MHLPSHLPVVAAALGRDDISDERALLIGDNRGDMGEIWGDERALLRGEAQGRILSRCPLVTV